MSRENRFVELSEEEIKSLLDKKTPKNTKKATNFGIKVFDGKKYIFLFSMIINTDFYPKSTVSITICRFVYMQSYAGKL